MRMQLQMHARRARARRERRGAGLQIGGIRRLRARAAALGIEGCIAGGRRRDMGVAVVRGLLLGGLAWILWDKLGALGLAALPTALLLLLFWNQESLLYVPRKGQYKQRPSGFKPLDNYEELTLVTMDGAKITAWFIKQHERHSDGRSAKNCPTVVFLVRMYAWQDWLTLLSLMLTVPSAVPTAWERRDDG